MKNLSLLTLGLAVLSISCADSEWYDEYFGGDAYMLEQSHANVMRKFTFNGEVEEGVAWGFDLDGVNNTSGEESTCYEYDYIDPEGRTGIDNQLAKIWTDLEPLVGEATQALVQGAINQGDFLLLIELEGVDDLKNDDSVNLHLFRGRQRPMLSTDNLIIPDQTFYVDEDFSASTVKNLKIVDGKIEAGPIDFQVPIDILEASFVMDVKDGKIRFEIDENGDFKGYIGGFINHGDVLDELIATDAVEEAMLVAPFFERNADRNRVNGKCTEFSVGFGFEGTTSYVVRFGKND